MGSRHTVPGGCCPFSLLLFCLLRGLKRRCSACYQTSRTYSEFAAADALWVTGFYKQSCVVSLYLHLASSAPGSSAGACLAVPGPGQPRLGGRGRAALAAGPPELARARAACAGGAAACAACCGSRGGGCRGQPRRWGWLWRGPSRRAAPSAVPAGTLRTGVINTPQPKGH